MTSVERHGRVLLFVVFLSLLAGRFGVELPGTTQAIDVRAIAAPILIAAVLLWLSVASVRTKPVNPAAFLSLFLAFCSWMALSASWAPASARTGAGLLDLGYLAVFLILALTVSSRLPKEALGSLWWWVLTVGVVYIVLAILVGPDHQGRYSAPGGGPNVFVRIMALAALATLYLAVSHRKVWTLSLLPLFLAGALISGSRGGVAAIGVMALFGAQPILARMSKRSRRWAVGMVLAGTALSWITIGRTLMATIANRFFQTTILDGHDGSRVEIFETSISIFLQSPLAGVGLDGFHAAEPRFEYAHNLFLAAAAEGGAVGIGLLFGAVLLVVRTIWKARPPSTEALFAGVAGVLFMTAGVFSGDYYDSRFMWFFFGLAIIEARRLQHGAAKVPVRGQPVGVLAVQGGTSEPLTINPGATSHRSTPWRLDAADRRKGKHAGPLSLSEFQRSRNRGGLDAALRGG